MSTGTSLGADIRRHLTVLFLSFAGGGIDAIALLGFGVMTAAQTGNTIILGVSLAGGRFVTGYHSAVSVAAYVIGAALGEFLIVSRRRSLPQSAAARRALVGELAIQCAILVFWRQAGAAPGVTAAAGLVALIAITMGIQSAAVLRLHFEPKTTYVTGTLTKFSTETVRRLRHGKECLPGTGSSVPGFVGPPPEEGPRIYGIDWLVYIVGATISALLFLQFREFALLLPSAAIIAAIRIEALSGGDGNRGHG